MAFVSFLNYNKMPLLFEPIIYHLQKIEGIWETTSTHSFAKNEPAFLMLLPLI